jgi:hypothetical protein
MFAGEVANYLAEAARVLKPGGRCLFTFFLLNDDARPADVARQHLPLSSMTRATGAWRTWNGQRTQSPILSRLWPDLLRSAGLRIRRIYYGGWCGRPEHVVFRT